MNILDKNSLRLSVLDDALIDDEVFASAAIKLLATENPLSTYTKTTAGMALINHLMIERALDCYERGQIVDPASVTVLPDANGDYETAINSVNNSLYIHASELSEVLNKIELPLPKILQNLTLPKQCNDEIKNENINKPRRFNRLYGEVKEIEGYLTIGQYAIREILNSYIGKNGSCIQSINKDNSISWMDWNGNKQVTDSGSFSKWLSRQKNQT